jgi:hypothetical protein
MNSLNKTFAALRLCASLSLFAALAACSHAAEKPNVVFIKFDTAIRFGKTELPERRR